MKLSPTMRPAASSHIGRTAHSRGPLHPFFGVRGAAVAIALVAGLLFCQVAVAADAARFEAESMSYGPFAAVATSDGASGAKALRYENAGTATKQVVSSPDATKVVVRARNSDYSSGTKQQLRVLVDGVNKGTQQLRSRTYEDYTFSTVIPSGTHTIGVAGMSLKNNDAMLVDTVALVAPDVTTPDPEPPDPGGTVWTAGGEVPMDNEWASLSTTDHCATNTFLGISDASIRRSQENVSSGLYSYRIDLFDGDECYGERAEITQGNPPRPGMTDRLFEEGQERWISYDMYLGNNVQTAPPSWEVITQMKQLTSLGSPVIELNLREGNYNYSRTTSDPNNQWPTGFVRKFPLATAHTGVWTRWVWHVKFSPDPSVGYVEIFADTGNGQGMRQLLPLTKGSTMKISNGVTVKSHFRVGMYRAAAVQGQATLYFDRVHVATNRQDAERGDTLP